MISHSKVDYQTTFSTNQGEDPSADKREICRPQINEKSDEEGVACDNMDGEDEGEKGSQLTENDRLRYFPFSKLSGVSLLWDCHWCPV